MQQATFFDTEWRESPNPHQGARLYYSGANRPYDAHGLIRAGVAVGVAAPELGKETARLLVDYTRVGGQVFVDSGAFPSSRKGQELDFRQQVFPVYKRLLDAGAIADNVLLVAPDYVGNQARSRSLLAEHQNAVRRLLARGASVMIPLQKGLIPTAWLWREAVAMFGADGLVAGIPSRDAAFSVEDLQQFLHSACPARLHMLGLGADKARLLPSLALVAQMAPNTLVSYDAPPESEHISVPEGGLPNVSMPWCRPKAVGSERRRLPRLG
jgi:hypothetical protein